MGSWEPNNPNRCQAVEQRLVRDRNKRPSHMESVQCSLPRGHEGAHVARRKAFA